MADIEWRPFSEIPDGMKSVFACQPGHTWVIAHKSDDGIWRAAFGLIQPEIRKSEQDKMFFIPLDVIPPVPQA